MEHILDFDDDNIFEGYLFVQQQQVAPIETLLEEYSIPYRVTKAVENTIGGIIPETAFKQLAGADYIIAVPKNMQVKVDKIMDERPELLHDSRNVRKLFLANALDDEGLIDILLFPGEWMERDEVLALEILKERGIVVPTSDYNRLREERKVERLEDSENSKLRKKQSLIYVVGGILLAIATLAILLFGLEL